MLDLGEVGERGWRALQQEKTSRWRTNSLIWPSPASTVFQSSIVSMAIILVSTSIWWKGRKRCQSVFKAGKARKVRDCKKRRKRTFKFCVGSGCFFIVFPNTFGWFPKIWRHVNRSNLCFRLKFCCAETHFSRTRRRTWHVQFGNALYWYRFMSQPCSKNQITQILFWTFVGHPEILFTDSSHHRQIDGKCKISLYAFFLSMAWRNTKWAKF